MTDLFHEETVRENLLDSVWSAVLTAEMNLPLEEDALEVPPSFDRRIRRKIKLRAAGVFLRRHARSLAAVFVLTLALGIAVLAAGSARADLPAYLLTSETDLYGENLTVVFTANRTDTEKSADLVPKSAAAVLTSEPISVYRAEAAYLERYESGVQYEQALLGAGGETVIPIAGRVVKNIVIGDRAAVLAFDATSAAILWQDGMCSYYLTGPFSADDAMRMAREMAEGK